MKLKTFILLTAAAALLSACNHLTAQNPPPGLEPPPLEEIIEPEVEVVEEPVIEEVEPEPEPIVEEVPVDRTTKVALILPLSGRHAGIGQALLNAAQMALFELGGEDFEIIVGDTAGDATQAGLAAQSAIDEGASLILGPLFSASMQEVTRVAAFRQVPVVAFSNNTAVAQPGAYIMGIAPELQINRVVTYAALQGHQIFSLLAPDSRYGTLVAEAFQEATLNSLVEVHAIARYDPLAEDISPEIQLLADYLEREKALEEERERLETAGDEASLLALKALEVKDTLGPPPFDAILLPQGGREILSVAPLLNYYDVDPVDVRFLGTSLWEDESLVREPSLQGGWFVAPDPGLWKAFRDRYRNFYKEDPPRLATLAFDATALAIVMARQAGDSPFARPYRPETLTDPSGFAGVDGAFRFLPDGRVQRGLAVLEMSEDGFVVIDPAPVTFQEEVF